ncbi:hypothetical protein MMC25_004792 [Agyrium rufum]|nr:hypothetical protein [Agyrium rufum]
MSSKHPALRPEHLAPSTVSSAGRGKLSSHQQAQSLPPIADTLRFTSTSPSSASLMTPRSSTSGPSPRFNVPEAYINENEQKSSRPIRMHNILNPSNVSDAQIYQQNTATPAESPQTSVSSVSWRPSDRLTQSPSEASSTSINLPGIITHPSSNASTGRNSLSGGPPYNHRNFNPCTINPPTGAIDAKAQLFLPLRDAMNLSAPPPSLPSVSAGFTPPAGHRNSYGFPGMPTTSAPTSDYRAAESCSRGPMGESASPSTSQSSYSHVGRNSPGSQQYQNPVGHGPQSHYQPHSMRGPPSDGQSSMSSEVHYAGGSGNAYQLFTLQTEHGPIQVPVDTQAASKMADEKRKRNAGASARFRQRRKEKERESSQLIAKLEGQIRSLDEEKEYYKGERDYFRDVAMNPGQAPNVPRIPSPRHRRNPSDGSSTQGTGPVWNQQADERGSQDGRNTRRRISANLTTFDLAQAHPSIPKHSPKFSPQQPGSYPQHAAQPPSATRSAATTLNSTAGPYRALTTPSLYEKSWNPAH